MDGYDFFISGDIVDSGTLAPCVGVVIYHRERQEAFIGHFSSMSYREIKKMILEAEDIFGDLSELEVLVAGNTPQEDNGFSNDEELEIYQEIMIEKKKQDEFVMSAFKDGRFDDSKVLIKWNKPRNYCNLLFNVSTGENIADICDDTYRRVYFGCLQNY